jgi:HJR/Mrr/RecB family endonuclease
VIIELITSTSEYWRTAPTTEVVSLVDDYIQRFSLASSPTSDPCLAAWEKVRFAVLCEGSRDRSVIFDALDDREGEYFAAHFLKLYGSWVDAEVTQRSRDDGVDVVGKLALAFDQTVDAVAQVKWYKPGNSVSLDEVKAFITSAGGRFGVFITTSHFSDTSHELRSRYSNSLLLLDGGDLARYVAEATT